MYCDMLKDNCYLPDLVVPEGVEGGLDPHVAPHYALEVVEPIKLNEQRRTIEGSGEMESVL